MLGTAAPATRWLLIEHPGGWAPAALDSPGIDDAVADRLHRTALEVGGRVVLIRRPGRAAVPGPPEQRRWTVLDLDGRQQWGTWRRSTDLLAAGSALLARPGRLGRRPPARADAPGLHPRAARRLLCGPGSPGGPGPRGPVAAADLGVHPHRRGPVRRQPARRAGRHRLRRARRRQRRRRRAGPPVAERWTSSTCAASRPTAHPCRRRSQRSCARTARRRHTTCDRARWWRTATSGTSRCSVPGACRHGRW